MRKGIMHFVSFFLLGAIINIAVAWSWILFVPYEISYATMSYYARSSQSSDLRIKYFLPQYVFVRSDLSYLMELELNNRGYEQYSVSGTEFDIRGVRSAVPLYRRIEAGWPLHSFRGENIMTTNGFESSFMLSVPESLNEKFEFYYLPFKPTWPGFVVNTVLFGGIVWLLIYGPLDFRRFRRCKHGKCVKCGYPKGESDVCTECGSPLTVNK